VHVNFRDGFTVPPACWRRKEEGISLRQTTRSSIRATVEGRAEEGRDIRAQGSVNIAISEEGDVTEAKVVRASSPEAADMLLKRARSMKFQSRPGCGTFRTTVNYTLQ
jgi:hypothetical protein